MNERRRRARVQGGWSAPIPTKGTNSTVKCEANKMTENRTLPKPPLGLRKNADSTLPMSHKFFYEPQEEDFKEKLELKVIDKGGVYDISTKPSGLSRIRFFPNFLEWHQADELFKILYDELPWQQMTGVHNGHRYLQPRLNVYYSDVEYEYSGTVHPATAEWPVSVMGFKGQIEEATGLQLNGVLANLYRDEHDSVAWHADDEPELGPNPTVVSVSLGATRNFYLRKNPSDTNSDDYSDCQHYKVPLPHGSLLIMEGCMQSDWQHCVPKEYHSREPRINLTFRALIQQ